MTVQDGVAGGGVTSREQRDIALVPADPARATVYAEGWQSWSTVSALPAGTAPDQVTSPESVVIDCQPGAVAPPGVHQGSGLLAINPGRQRPSGDLRRGDR